MVTVSCYGTHNYEQAISIIHALNYSEWSKGHVSQ